MAVRDTVSRSATPQNKQTLERSERDRGDQIFSMQLDAIGDGSLGSACVGGGPEAEPPTCQNRLELSERAECFRGPAATSCHQSLLAGSVPPAASVRVGPTSLRMRYYAHPRLAASVYSGSERKHPTPLAGSTAWTSGVELELQRSSDLALFQSVRYTTKVYARAGPAIPSIV